MEGQRNVMIGIENDQIVYVPFTKAIKNDKPIDRELVNVLHELSILINRSYNIKNSFMFHEGVFMR